ncbi:MAG TPA: 30S ribosomal protein S6 [Dehalococcoidia bacterium]|nr:30S ribosomal protein S6 [Dehalococcoidia bacterium]
MDFEGDKVPSYELVFIVSPEVADEEVPNTVSKVSEFINRIGGSVTEVNQWGRRKLAYPIRRFIEGNYVLAQLELKPALTKELEANLRLSEEVLRHLLIKLRD